MIGPGVLCPLATLPESVVLALSGPDLVDAAGLTVAVATELRVGFSRGGLELTKKYDENLRISFLIFDGIYANRPVVITS
jgi:hypothetical protein